MMLARWRTATRNLPDPFTLGWIGVSTTGGVLALSLAALIGQSLIAAANAQRSERTDRAENQRLLRPIATEYAESSVPDAADAPLRDVLSALTVALQQSRGQLVRWQQLSEGTVQLTITLQDWAVLFDFLTPLLDSQSEATIVALTLKRQGEQLRVQLTLGTLNRDETT